VRRLRSSAGVGPRSRRSRGSARCKCGSKSSASMVRGRRGRRGPSDLAGFSKACDGGTCPQTVAPRAAHPREESISRSCPCHGAETIGSTVSASGSLGRSCSSSSTPRTAPLRTSCCWHSSDLLSAGLARQSRDTSPRRLGVGKRPRSSPELRRIENVDLRHLNPTRFTRVDIHSPAPRSIADLHCGRARNTSEEPRIRRPASDTHAQRLRMARWTPSRSDAFCHDIRRRDRGKCPRTCRTRHLLRVDRRVRRRRDLGIRSSYVGGEGPRRELGLRTSIGGSIGPPDDGHADPPDCCRLTISVVPWQNLRTTEVTGAPFAGR